MSPDGGAGGGGDGGGASGTGGGGDWGTSTMDTGVGAGPAAGPSGPTSGPGMDSLGIGPTMGFDPTFGPQAPVAIEGFDPAFGPQIGDPVGRALMGGLISAFTSQVPFAGVLQQGVNMARSLGLAETGRADPATGSYGAVGQSEAGQGYGSTGGDTTNIGVASVSPPRQSLTQPTPSIATITSTPSPSVAALAQALRTVPDLGYSPGGTVFGSQSTDQTTPIWNKASLRVTDQGTA